MEGGVHTVINKLQEAYLAWEANITLSESRNFPAIMGPENVLPCSQDLDSGPHSPTHALQQ